MGCYQLSLIGTVHSNHEKKIISDQLENSDRHIWSRIQIYFYFWIFMGQRTREQVFLFCTIFSKSGYFIVQLTTPFHFLIYFEFCFKYYFILFGVELKKKNSAKVMKIVGSNMKMELQIKEMIKIIANVCLFFILFCFSQTYFLPIQASIYFGLHFSKLLIRN